MVQLLNAILALVLNQQKHLLQVIDKFSSIQLYPNPNTGNFVIELTLSNNSSLSADVQILNVFGQMIYMNRTTIVEVTGKNPNLPYKATADQ